MPLLVGVELNSIDVGAARKEGDHEQHVIVFGEDVIVEQEGANVFVEQEAAPFLDDKVLDAAVDADKVSFSILESRQDWSNDGQPESFDPRRSI